MVLRSALVVCVALLLPAAAAAQTSDVLTGRVLGQDGNPVVGARVEATSIETELTRSVLTGPDGRYLIVFPDGGGIYVLRVSFLGMADEVRAVVREAGEELLLANVVLYPQPVALDQLTIEVHRTPADADPGSESVVLSQDLLNRLPLADLEPGTVALLAAGVIGTGVDTLTDRMGFSVGGMREELNQVTLDGVRLNDDTFGVPEEGVRRTEVTTSTFDVSRGGFAGGQVAMTSARGNNRASGSLTYRIDDDALQLRAVPTANAFTRHNLGGSWSGPLIEDRLFYNLSFQFERNLNHRFALAAGDPLAAQRSGVAVDSIARFLSILEESGAFPVDHQTGPFTQPSSDLRLQGRFDWNIAQGSERSHTLSTRLNGNLNRQDSTRINTLDLMQHGGELGRNHRQASVNLTSRFGRRWTNEATVAFQENWSESLPYIELPEAQVRVTSEFEDGTRGSRTLLFGGNRNMPTEAYGREFSLSNELSIMLPVGDQMHRIKLGGSIERSRDVSRSTDNLFGTFRFGSLADFHDNRPDRYERALAEREVESGRVNASLYLGDTWRVTEPLEVTLGLRWDYSWLRQQPGYNPDVEAAFGRRTDIVPRSAAWSPRLGFTYRLPGEGRQRPSINGGIGYFAGRAPINIFSTAVRQTGLPDAEQRLICIGSAVPPPDWQGYRQDPTAVPDSCADGDPGAPFQSSRAPNVTLIDPDQALPGSIRFDIGYRRSLPMDFSGNFRYQHSRGRGLWGYADLNLDESRYTHLGSDDRIFFGDPDAIVRRTGAVSMVSSRLHPEFGHVYDVTSSLESTSHQFTAQVNGMLPPRIRTNVNYTLGFAVDQGSGSLASVTTAGNPNEVAWATANNDRRHNLNVSLTYALSESLELTANGRVQSGTPFTPLVNRDINGDGLRNDRAFVFDPRTVEDTVLANGMMRLFENVPARIRGCLESQLGSVAARNSCRNGWTQSLNMRANFRPVLPNLQRRLTVSADVRNILTGLDYAVHGRDEMKGWGEGQRADPNLLEVRGFDPATGTFRFHVNEGFGQDRRGPNAFRNAFSVTVSARLVLGGNPNQIRGFNTSGPGGGGRGGQGGGRPAGPGAPGGGFQLPALVAMLESRRDDPDVDRLADSLLANPVARILDTGELLGLSAAQVSSLQSLADSTGDRLDARRPELVRALGAIIPTLLEGDGGGLGPARREIERQFQAEVQPAVDGGRRDAAAALAQARQRLTDQQWAQVPSEIRALLDQPQAGRPGAGAFNPVATLDRMLANPLPVILDLDDILGLAPEQVTRIRALSDTLQQQLNARRETLGRRFDNAPPQEQARIFQDIQPDIEEGRGLITSALRTVEAILTPEQWERLPRQLRDPFRSRPAGQPEAR